MILVTGAAGKTGRAIVNQLVRQGIDVRASVFKEKYVHELYQLGANDVVVGNLSVSNDLKNSLTGVTAVYHICPNMHPDEIAIADSVLDAVRASACHRVVFHSVLHPQASAMPHHWHKLRVEESLFESGLDYTILQPSAYMQNIIMDLKAILLNAAYHIPYDPDSKFSFVDLEDIAEVASMVLTTPGHIGAIYELNGPEILSVRDVMAIIGTEHKVDIEIDYQSQQDWMKQVGACNFSTFKRDCLSKMFAYYDRHGFWGNSNVLKWLLGREPTTVRQLVARKSSDTKPA